MLLLCNALGSGGSLQQHVPSYVPATASAPATAGFFVCCAEWRIVARLPLFSVVTTVVLHLRVSV